MQLGKIIAAGTMGLLMAGSTVAFAATLADYPQPFVSTDGAANFLVVVGAIADPADVVGAIDVATRLGSDTYSSYLCPGSTGSTTVTGEGASVATTNMKIYLGDNLRKTGARYTFTQAEFPTVLKGGTMEDSVLSTNYDYNQYLELSTNYTVQFNKIVSDSGINTDPDLVLRHSSGSNPNVADITNYLYKMKVVFEKEVNGTNIVGETLNLFGKTWTVASQTNFATPELVLYGSANTKVLTQKESTVMEVGDASYDVTLEGVSSGNYLVLTVNGETKSVDTSVSRTKTIGGVQVYVEDIFFYGSTRDDNQAKISIGSSTLNLKSGSKAATTVGNTKTSIKGTYVVLSTSDGKLSMIEIYVVGPNTYDILAVGDSFTDPIFGAFSLDFASATPSLKDPMKAQLEIKNSGDSQLQATFMNYRVATQTFTWANGASNPSMQDGAGNDYVVAEGHRVFNNQYVMVDSGGFSHLFQLQNLENDGTETGALDLYDVFTGTTYNVLLGTDNQSTKVIDGQTYFIDGSAATSYVKITWGTSAGFSNVGSENVVWPIMPGIRGERYTLAENPTDVNITSGTLLQLPTGLAVITLSGGSQMTLSAYTPEGYASSGCTNVNITNGDSCALLISKSSTTGAPYYNITGIGPTAIKIKPAGSTAIAYTEDAIALIEEQVSSTNSYSVWVQVANETSGNIAQIIAAAPDFTYAGMASAALVSSDYTTQYIDLYGVFAERDTYGQDWVKLWYPDEQTTMDFFVLGTSGAVSTQTGAAGGSVKQSIPVSTKVAKLDTAVLGSDKENKNLILVGGPVVNTLVAALAAEDKTKNTDWYYDQGAGTAIIDLVDNAFVSGKAALVVAGMTKEDTGTVTSILLDYGSHADELTGARAIFKDGVLTTDVVDDTDADAV